MNMQLGNAGFEPTLDSAAHFYIVGRNGSPMLHLLTQIADLIIDWEFDMGVETLQGGPWAVEGDQYLLASTQVDLWHAGIAYDMATGGIVCARSGNTHRLIRHEG
jgi:hypothetical protein